MSFRKPVPNIPPVLAITDDAGTNTLTATYTGPAYTNVPMTATDTSTVVLGDTLYTHDANGNLIGDATFIYQYDLANQLTNVIRKADNTVVLQCRYGTRGQTLRWAPGDRPLLNRSSSDFPDTCALILGNAIKSFLSVRGGWFLLSYWVRFMDGQG